MLLLTKCGRGRERDREKRRGKGKKRRNEKTRTGSKFDVRERAGNQTVVVVARRGGERRGEREGERERESRCMIDGESVPLPS